MHFCDSTGTQWEVFEVRRPTGGAGVVSPGLESGWLTFVSDREKRRLSPPPSSWATASDAELERLCAAATPAPPMRYPLPQLRRRTATAADAPPFPVPSTPPAGDGAAAAAVPPPAGAVSDLSRLTGDGPALEETVRRFAREARAQHVPVIEALVRLKARLGRIDDVRQVRAWFIDTYYFDAGAPTGDVT